MVAVGIKASRLGVERKSKNKELDRLIKLVHKKGRPQSPSNRVRSWKIKYYLEYEQE